MDDNTYYIEGDCTDPTKQMPLIGYLLKCVKCNRKIHVDAILIGVNHTLSVSACCAECLEIRDEFRQDHPDIAEKIDKWINS